MRCPTKPGWRNVPTRQMKAFPVSGLFTGFGDVGRNGAGTQAGGVFRLFRDSTKSSDVQQKVGGPFM